MSMEAGSAEVRRLTGRWNLTGRMRRRGIRAHDHRIPKDYAARGQRFSSKPPFYSVLKFMALSLLALVALRYQGKRRSPFQENPIPTYCFLVVFCVYCVIAGLMEQTQSFETKWSRIFRRAAIASGVFSVVSLVSIFLPYPTSIVPLIVCTTIQSVILAWPLLCHAYNLIQRGITTVLDNIHAKFVCSRGSNFRNEVGLPA